MKFINPSGKVIAKLEDINNAEINGKEVMEIIVPTNTFNSILFFNSIIISSKINPAIMKVNVFFNPIIPKSEILNVNMEYVRKKSKELPNLFTILIKKLRPKQNSVKETISNVVGLREKELKIEIKAKGITKRIEKMYPFTDIFLRKFIFSFWRVF